MRFIWILWIWSRRKPKVVPLVYIPFQKQKLVLLYHHDAWAFVFVCVPHLKFRPFYTSSQNVLSEFGHWKTFQSCTFNFLQTRMIFRLPPRRRSAIFLCNTQSIVVIPYRRFVTDTLSRSVGKELQLYDPWRWNR